MENRKQHSALLAAAIDQSAQLSDAIHEILGTTATVNARERLALAYFSLSLEHREAILLLVDVGACASATALHRPMLEAIIAGAWIEACATDKEIEETATFRRAPSKVVTMVKQLRSTHPLGNWFRVLYEHYGIVGDYAHGHLRQLSRWLGPDGVGPRYSDDQMIELLRNADVVGRQRPVVTVRDFSSLATCYAELSGRVRPEADIAVVVAGLRFQALPLFNKEAWWTLIN